LEANKKGVYETMFMNGERGLGFDVFATNKWME
jgi:hypothetical protein